MTNFSFPLPFGLNNSTKVFSKIYNAFYCAKKAEPTSGVVESETAETALDSVIDGSKQDRIAWFEALKVGDIDKVKHLLSTGAVNISITDEFGWCALHLATWNGYKDICDLLIGNKADVNQEGQSGSTAVSLAAQKGHTEILQLLLDANCDIHRTARLADSMDVTALHLAAQHGHTEVVKILLGAGATVNASMIVRGIKGVTPLHLAVEANHMDIMDLLIEAGCDVQSSTQASSETTC